MKIIAEIDCESRHCGECENMMWLHCHTFNTNLRQTGRGVLRCKQCMESEQKYKKLDALKTCKNCENGPRGKCTKIKHCTRGWGDVEDMWELKK